MDKLPTDIIDIIVEYSVIECFECNKTNMRKIYTIIDLDYCSRCIKKVVMSLQYDLNYTYLKDEIEFHLDEVNLMLDENIFFLSVDLLAELSENTNKRIKMYILAHCSPKTISSPLQMFNILYKWKIILNK